MNIIDSSNLREKMEDSFKQSTKGCIIRPSVAVIKIGDNDKVNEDIKLKEEACNKVGIYFRIYEFDDSVSELTIINKIKELNNDDYVNGIMLELPISEKYNSRKIINTIQNSKDVDGMTDINVGRFISGRKTIIPCISLAISTLLKENNIDIEGKHVVIIGRGKMAGRPIINTMINENVTMTICNSSTKRLKNYTEAADILISATGVKDLITPDMIKSDVVVINVGYQIENGKIIDDIDPSSISKKASVIITAEELIKMRVTMFLKNTLLCYNNKK